MGGSDLELGHLHAGSRDGPAPRMSAAAIQCERLRPKPDQRHVQARLTIQKSFAATYRGYCGRGR
jgi:hypothetical protein